LIFENGTDRANDMETRDSEKRNSAEATREGSLRVNTPAA
jgi:hypothetical protein